MAKSQQYNMRAFEEQIIPSPQQYDMSAFETEQRGEQVPTYAQTLNNISEKDRILEEQRQRMIKSTQLQQEISKRAKEHPEESEEERLSWARKAMIGAVGAVRGLTFDFSDEIVGGIGAGIQHLMAPSGDPLTLKERYQQTVGDIRDQQRALEQEAPLASMAGQLAGSAVIPARALGGTAVRGAKSVGQAIRGSIVPGVIGGGLYAAGASEADLTTTEGRRSATLDVLTGAGFGAAGGVVMPVAFRAASGVARTAGHHMAVAPTVAGAGIGAGIGALVADDPIEGAKIGAVVGFVPGIAGTVALKGIQKAGQLGRVTAPRTFPFLSNIMNAYDQGLAGKRLVGKQAFKLVGEELYGMSKRVTDDLFEYGNQLARLQRGILEKTNKVVDISAIPRILRESKDKAHLFGLDDVADFRRIRDQIRLFARQNPSFRMKPVAAYRVSQIFSDMIDGGKITGQAGKRALIAGREEARRQVSELTPELANINKSIHNIQNLMAKAGLQPTQRPTMDARQQEAMIGQVSRLIQNIDKTSPGGSGANQKMRHVYDALREFDQVLGSNQADGIIQSMKDLGIRYELARMSGQSASAAKQLVSITAYSTGIPNIIGLGAKAAGEQLQHTARWFKQATPDMLYSLGAYMFDRADRTSQLLAGIIEKMAIESPQGRQALLFTLFQNPAYRKALGIGQPVPDKNEKQIELDFGIENPVGAYRNFFQESSREFGRDLEGAGEGYRDQLDNLRRTE